MLIPLLTGLSHGVRLLRPGCGVLGPCVVLTPWVFSDEVGALNYAVAILQALYAREQTGLGQHVETSQLGGANRNIDTIAIAIAMSF